MIFHSCNVAPKQELGAWIGKIQVGSGRQSKGEQSKKPETTTTYNAKKKNCGAKPAGLKYMHLDEGDQIPIHEKFDSLTQMR